MKYISGDSAVSKRDRHQWKCLILYVAVSVQCYFLPLPYTCRDPLCKLLHPTYISYISQSGSPVSCYLSPVRELPQVMPLTRVKWTVRDIQDTFEVAPTGSLGNPFSAKMFYQSEWVATKLIFATKSIFDFGKSAFTCILYQKYFPVINIRPLSIVLFYFIILLYNFQSILSRLAQTNDIYKFTCKSIIRSRKYLSDQRQHFSKLFIRAIIATSGLTSNGPFGKNDCLCAGNQLECKM